ncbi:MAG: ABC transporter ATP-binding protein [Promethearchaeota archaeon]
MFSVKIQSKSFPNPENSQIEVLKNLDFTIHDHDFLTIIGPSGCGKTTLLRIIAGFDKNFQGNITYIPSAESYANNVNPKVGTVPSSFEPLGQVGYIPQDFSLFPWLTVEENIRFGLKINKIPKKEQDLIVDRLLKLVRMENYRDYLPKEISGGMQQKIAICRAIAINPISNLIVMDEPFSALDAQTRNSLQTDLLDIWKKQNLTIIFVTHNIDEATFLSQRVLVLSELPARMVKMFSINLPHPRDRTNFEFNSIRRDLLGYLKIIDR